MASLTQVIVTLHVRYWCMSCNCGAQLKRAGERSMIAAHSLTVAALAVTAPGRILRFPPAGVVAAYKRRPTGDD